MGKKILKNQVISSEGIQKYYENGTIVRKLKLWENLKQFVGNKIPNTDGHPNSKVVDTTTKTYDSSTLKACPKGKNTLCADVEVDENAPNRKGYSIGYLFEEIKKPGIYNGEPYDVYQKLVKMDHLAFTNHNRHPFAIKISGDENEEIMTQTLLTALPNKDQSNLEVVKYLVCHDSFNTFINGDLSNENSKKDPKIKPHKNENTEGYNTMTELELKLQKELNEAKVKVAKMEAINAAGDANAKAIGEIQEKLTSIQTASDAKDIKIAEQAKTNAELKKANDANILKAHTARVNSFVEKAKKRGCDEKKLSEILGGCDAKSIDLLIKYDGILPEKKIGVQIGTPEGDSTPKGGKDSRKWTTAHMYYDADKKEMVLPEYLTDGK